MVDLAAQTAGKLDEWIEQSDLFKILNAVDSVRLLEATLDNFSDSPVQLVVVKIWVAVITLNYLVNRLLSKRPKRVMNTLKTFV